MRHHLDCFYTLKASPNFLASFPNPEPQYHFHSFISLKLSSENYLLFFQIVVIQASSSMFDYHFKFFKVIALIFPLLFLPTISPFGYYSLCSRSYSFHQWLFLSFAKIRQIIHWLYPLPYFRVGLSFISVISSIFSLLITPK